MFPHLKKNELHIIRTVLHLCWQLCYVCWSFHWEVEAVVLSICSPVVDKRVSDYTGLHRPQCMWHSGQWDTQSACFLSGVKGGGLTVNCLDIASVNKTRVLRFSFPFCPVNVDVFLFKRLVGEPWEQRWHQSRTGFPSSRSRSQLRAARWNTTGGDAVKRHMHPSFMRLIRCFGWLAAEGAFSLVHNPPLVNVMSFAVIWPSTKVLTEWSDHQSYYTSSWWSNECLYQLSWQSIQ